MSNYLTANKRLPVLLRQLKNAQTQQRKQDLLILIEATALEAEAECYEEEERALREYEKTLSEMTKARLLAQDALAFARKHKQ